MATEPLVFEDEPVEATVESIVTSRPGGNFLKVNPSSHFQEFDMLKLRYMYQIPKAVEISAPLPPRARRLGHSRMGEFYEFVFEAGFKFPVPKLVREVVSHFKIAPSQLMPNAWRILMTLESLV